jgi:hypothetical protein
VSAAGAALADTAPAAPVSTSTVLPTEWKRWNGRYYRLEADGHLSCYNDGSWRSDCTASFPDPAKQRPLSCNSLSWRDKQNRKVTGYQEVGHWCNTAYANLFAEWVSYKTIGHDVELATGPRGDVMCKSIDGTTCLPPGSHTTADPIAPLVCGRALRERQGGTSTGYDNPAHWCSTPEIVLQTRPQADVRWVEATFDEYMKTSYIVHTPEWKAAEEPAWIIRLRRSETIAADSPFHSFWVDLMGQYRDADDNVLSRHANILYTGANYAVGGTNEVFFTEMSPMGGKGPQAPFLTDSEGRLSVALQVDSSGRMGFFHEPGWPAPAAALASNRDPDGQASARSRHVMGGPWLASEGGAKHNFIALYATSRFGREVTVSEILMLKKRRVPAP